MSAVNPSNSVISLVETRLAALRRQLATWLWVDGLMRLGWTALGLIALDLAIDWFFRFDFAQRMILLILMLGTLLYVARRWLITPLSAEINDDALCLVVEKQNPKVKQSLISALQFARLEGIENRGMSLELVKKTIAQGLQYAEEINFANVLDRQAWSRNLALLGTALLLLIGAGTAIAAKTPLTTWFQRNILLTDEQWPQKTYLIIEGVNPKTGKVVFPRGGEWTQVVRVDDKRSKVIPENVVLEFAYARGRAPQPMKKVSDTRFEALFANVLEPFKFRARGGDEVTRWVQVDLVESPALEQLQLAARLPAYAGSTTEPFPPGQGPYFVLQGSTLTVNGTSNKPLKKAALLIDGVQHDLQIAATDDKRASLVTGTFANAAPGQYVIDLEDTLGLHPLQPISFGIRPRIDREPKVRAKFVGVGSMGMISPQARLPVEVHVSDDFGLTKIVTEFSVTGDEEGKSRTGEISFESLAGQEFERDISFEDVLEVNPLALVPGESLTLTFVAADNDDVHAPDEPDQPNVGKSSNFQLRVVTEEELRAEILRREKEQRQEFERLVKNQEELLTDTKALTAETQSLAELNPEQRNLLMQIQRRQKLVATGSSGIAERLELAVLEALNNRIEKEGDAFERRVRSDVIAPLFVIVNERVPEVILRLDETRRLSGEQAARQESLAQAVAAQEKLLSDMQQVLSHMIKAEGFQEAINLILEIQRGQQDVLERALKEKQERLQRLLDEQKQP